MYSLIPSTSGSERSDSKTRRAVFLRNVCRRMDAFVAIGVEEDGTDDQNRNEK